MFGHAGVESVSQRDSRRSSWLREEVHRSTGVGGEWPTDPRHGKRCQTTTKSPQRGCSALRPCVSRWGSIRLRALTFLFESPLEKRGRLSDVGA